MLDKLNTVLLVLLFAFVAAVWGQSSKTQEAQRPEVGRYVAISEGDSIITQILDTATGKIYLMTGGDGKTVFGVVDPIQGSYSDIEKPPVGVK